MSTTTAAAKAKHILTRTSSLTAKATPLAPFQHQLLLATRPCRHQHRDLGLAHIAPATPSFSASSRCITPSTRRFFADKVSQKSRICYTCGSYEHQQSRCPEKKSGKKACLRCGSWDHRARDCASPRKCYRCGSEDHLLEACPKPKACFKCGSEDHLFAHCPQPADA